MELPKENLILLHGALGNSSQLQELAQLLAGVYITHTFNFSGHGGSVLPVKGFSIELFVSDVLDYMKSYSIKAAHFFGYSMGGYVALSLASKFPDKVLTAFTLATKFDWNPESAAREAGMLDPEKVSAKIPQFANKMEMLTIQPIGSRLCAKPQHLY